MFINALASTREDSLLDSLTAADLCRLSRTCKATYSVVRKYFKRAFRIENLLSRYFTPEEITKFRELQYLTGSLISGSTAVQFFDRDYYPESDLDLYLEHRFSRVLTEWLVGIGYRYVPSEEGVQTRTLEGAFALNPPERQHIPHLIEDAVLNGQDYPGSPWVFNFQKQHPLRKIQLITSLATPMQRILKFHSTCVMNVITHEKAYSLFPKATFEQRISLGCRLDGLVFPSPAALKYVDRGWKFVRLSDYSEGQARIDLCMSLAFGHRHVGDKLCWTITLSPVNFPPSFVETNSWTLSTTHYDTPAMLCVPVIHRKLKFSYVISLVEKHELDAYLWEDMRLKYSPRGRIWNPGRFFEENFDEQDDAHEMDENLQSTVRQHRINTMKGEEISIGGLNLRED